MTKTGLPKRLYKYRAFNVNTLRMLTEAEIYYANPKDFNDPLDSKPSLLVDVDCKDIEALLLRLIFQKSGCDGNAVLANHRYMSTEYGDYQTNSTARNYYISILKGDILELLRPEMSSWGIFSLSKKWDCPLMWSHYANEHRGLCIEYDVSDHLFERIEPVDYREPRSIKVSDLIKWKVDMSDEAEQNIFRTTFFVKAPQWRYEHEWRGMSKTHGIADAPVKISAVYFGLRCDSSIITATVKLHARSEHPVKFYQISADENSFRLKRRLLDVSEIEECGLKESSEFIFRDAFVEEEAKRAIIIAP